MSGNKCSYYNCNRSSRTVPGLRKRFFPITDSERCHKWIFLSGNSSLFRLDEKALSLRFLCREHFPKNTFNLKRLPAFVLPVHYRTTKTNKDIFDKEEKDKIVKEKPSETKMSKSLPKKTILLKVVNLSTPTNLQSKGKKLFILPKAINKRQLYHKPGTSNENPVGISASKKVFLQKLSLQPKILNKKQIYHKQRQVRLQQEAHMTQKLQFFQKSTSKIQLYLVPHAWSSLERLAATSIFNKSPSMYRFLKQQHFVLPPESIIHKWKKYFKIKPGYSSKLFKRLAHTVKCHRMKNKKSTLIK